VSRFVDEIGDIEPKNVRREHVIAFRDALQRQGLKSDNIAQHLAKLHTLFNVAISEGAFSVVYNPAHGVKARPDPKTVLADDVEEGFTATEVRRIFKAMKNETADFQWIVRLLAYHGARGKEICQLRCTDLVNLHAIDVIRVHDKSGGSVKNRQSVRDIPIHPKCRGIIAYAIKVAKNYGPDAHVFQSLKATRTTGREHCFQNYANGKFLREKVGISDRRSGSRQYEKSIHSFRHRFSTLCREAEMPDAIKYAIKGHALGKGEGGKYGAAPSLKLRAMWIAKIDPLNG
jgi:integrase